jgi:hypothetical protein
MHIMLVQLFVSCLASCIITRHMASGSDVVYTTDETGSTNNFTNTFIQIIRLYDIFVEQNIAIVFIFINVFTFS